MQPKRRPFGFAVDGCGVARQAEQAAHCARAGPRVGRIQKVVGALTEHDVTTRDGICLAVDVAVEQRLLHVVGEAARVLHRAPPLRVGLKFEGRAAGRISQRGMKAVGSAVGFVERIAVVERVGEPLGRRGRPVVVLAVERATEPEAERGCEVDRRAPAES